MLKEQNEIKLDDNSHNPTENSIKLDVSDLNNTNNQEEPLDSKIRYSSSLSSKNSEPPKPIQEQNVDVLPTLSSQIKTEESMLSPYFQGTLNEPILSTLKRDLLNIWYKMTFVLNPFADQRKKNYHIAQWDLWGPLMFNILLASTLSINSKNKGDMFVLIFMIFWVGSFFIYLNGNLLGAKLGMFNIMCLIGYCMVPLNFCSIIFALGTFHEFLRIIIIVFCCSWSSYSSIGFVKSLVPEDKRTLLIYPIILEYLFLSGVILMTRDIKPKSIN